MLKRMSLVALIFRLTGSGHRQRFNRSNPDFRLLSASQGQNRDRSKIILENEEFRLPVAGFLKWSTFQGDRSGGVIKSPKIPSQ